MIQGFKTALLAAVRFFSDFTPSTAFLSDIAAFEAVVIAIAIPLSFEIISRISERYNSEVISRRFWQEWAVRSLPIILMFNIVAAVGLRFFASGAPDSVGWKVSAWVVFSVFLAAASILVFKFIPRLKDYMKDPNFILDELFDEAEESLQ